MKEQKEKQWSQVKQLSQQIKSHPVSIEKDILKMKWKKQKKLAKQRENVYDNLKFETISINQLTIKMLNNSIVDE